MPLYLTGPFVTYFLQRGALACMEFTGNIFGYASSVVSRLHSCSIMELGANTIVVDRLLLFIHPLGSFMAYPSFYAMCHRGDPHCGMFGYARESSVCCLIIAIVCTGIIQVVD